ncbi:hypothetical protein [Algibacter sp. L3A6]|uniref:hypothetical protein n=1 Tax=Algibacter sp. L3A6 TaxID=2686366 RepID=UPI00131E942E|nr:hypothetical protein [Algibacter sp. L3A6]
MANKIAEKDIINLESDLKHNSFYSESDKRAIRTYIGAVDSREIGRFDIINALEISKELIKKKDSKDYQDYLKRHQSLSKRLEGFD